MMMKYFNAYRNDKQPLSASTDDFNYFVEQFDDIRILKYKLPGFETLSLQQKEYIFYLNKATHAGRDILWDQNFRYNLLIRKTIETIIDSYSGDRETPEYNTFLVYAKKVFFANGIHHHYSNDKFKPGFSESYFARLIKNTENGKLPLANVQTSDQLIALLTPVMFDEKLFARKVEQRAGADMIAESASNFYEDVTQEEVEEFYAGKTMVNDPHPISYGLNSKVVKINGILTEEVYKSGGKYGAAIDNIIQWLEKAITVTETDSQKNELGMLIEYYKTGDLKKWDEYNVAWAKNSAPIVDYINGFIENPTEVQERKS
jgi:dipeptidyl-peptidase-3